MKISKVTIKNFRGIEEKEIEFKPGFNLITGENGRGKTSILEAIAVGLGGFVAGLPDVATRHFSLDEVRCIYNETGDGSYNKKYIVPVGVSVEAEIDGEAFRWTRNKESIKASRSTIQPCDICKRAEMMASQDMTELPILAYLGAGRVWSQKKEKANEVFSKQYYRTVGYTDALLEASNIKLLLNWCVKMEMTAWKKNLQIAEYEAVKAAVAGFMDIMEEREGHEVFYDRQSEQLMYKVNDNATPIMQLSSGYQSLIWMAFDIAYRMAVLNPDKREHIAETSGVVLIDEIDMHLHPKWQWNVMPALMKVFPNVQFIAATHSPIMLAAETDLRIIDIDGDNVLYSASQYGYDMNAVLEQSMGAKSQNTETEKMIHSIYKAIADGAFDEAETMICRLAEITSENHPDVITARMDIMRRTKK